jgi:hypothetical protein
VFGTAWHTAVEHLLINSYSKESVEEAQVLFLQRYRQDFPPSSDEEMGAKHPLNALQSIQDYARKFQSDLREFNVLNTEIAGVVCISPSAIMYFKLDALLQEKESKKYLFIDHKTSQRKFSNWGDHWTLSTQMLMYFHALNCLYPKEELGSSKVRCSFFYDFQKKTSSFRPTEFEEHSINKSSSQMQSWLVRTNVWYQNLQYDMALLEDEENSDDVAMQAFPQNDTACFDFSRQCEYFDFCNCFGNPLELAKRGTPLGFKKSFWDPREQENIRERVDLTLKGPLHV